MKIALEHLGDAPVTFHFDEPVDLFPLLVDICSENGVAIPGRITGDLTVHKEFETVRVIGRLSAPLLLSCSRCLVEYSSFVDTGFTLVFRKGSDHTDSLGDELELSEADLLSSCYSGDEIDVTHEIEEQLAMEMPLKPLCSENCKGLCHECGADLNVTTCSCSTETVSLAFSALKNFKITSTT